MLEILPNALQVVKILLLVEIVAESECTSEDDHEATNEDVEDLPLASSPHPLTLANIDIAEHNDADSEDSVEDSDEECILSPKRIVHRKNLATCIFKFLVIQPSSGIVITAITTH